MKVLWSSLGSLLALCLTACAGAPAPGTTAAGPTTTGRVVVLPAESAAFPEAAARATEFLSRARVRGFGVPELSKVSLEVVQLSIECVEQTDACYEAVGRSLSASQLLFAQFDAGPAPEQIRVTVTLFDVDAAGLKRRAKKLFDSEWDAVYGMRDVIEEATRP